MSPLVRASEAARLVALSSSDDLVLGKAGHGDCSPKTDTPLRRHLPSARTPPPRKAEAAQLLALANVFYSHCAQPLPLMWQRQSSRARAHHSMGKLRQGVGTTRPLVTLRPGVLSAEGGAAPCQVTEDCPLSNTRQVLRGSQADPAMSPIGANTASPAHFPSGSGAPAPSPWTTESFLLTPLTAAVSPTAGQERARPSSGARAWRAGGGGAPSRGWAARTPPGDKGLFSQRCTPQDVGWGGAQPIAVPVSTGLSQETQGPAASVHGAHPPGCPGPRLQVPGRASEASRGGRSWHGQLQGRAPGSLGGAGLPLVQLLQSLAELGVKLLHGLSALWGKPVVGEDRPHGHSERPTLTGSGRHVRARAPTWPVGSSAFCRACSLAGATRWCRCRSSRSA